MQHLYTKRLPNLKSQRFEEYPGSPTHPFFYMSVFLKHHLFSHWSKREGTHFFLHDEFPFPWCIYIYMFTNLPPWKPFTKPFTPTLHKPHQPINPGELPDLQGHPHDNTRRAWLQGLDWSCPGKTHQKRLTFFWKPGNPHTKKEKNVGKKQWDIHGEKTLKIIECSMDAMSEIALDKTNMWSPAQASYTNSIPLCSPWERVLIDPPEKHGR